MTKYVNAPIVYSGNKYKLLYQILPLFPSDIKVFVDLFCGGGCVSVNVNAEKIYMNDINHYLIELHKDLRWRHWKDVDTEIHYTINGFNLNGHNRDGYNELRKQYNESHFPIDLYLLIVNGFKDQIRFNNKGEFNTSFREGRIFNASRQQKLHEYMFAIKERNIVFSSKSFEDFDIPEDADFVYLDPPYLVTTATYNDGKRGFEGWNEQNEWRLLRYIEDNIIKKGCRFALSNVLEHNGKENTLLKEWSKNFNVHHLQISTKNQSEQRYLRDEVLITNY